eukprot:5891956-Prymnesium_polylepis.1
MDRCIRSRLDEFARSAAHNTSRRRALVPYARSLLLLLSEYKSKHEYVWVLRADGTRHADGAR